MGLQAVAQAGVESEIAFRFGRDLDPRGAPWSAEEVRAAITGVHPAIEVPQTRFAALGQFGAFGLIADNGASGLGIVGEGDDPDVVEGIVLMSRGGQSLPVQLHHRIAFGQDGQPGPSRTLVLNRSGGAGAGAPG